MTGISPDTDTLIPYTIPHTYTLLFPGTVAYEGGRGQLVVGLDISEYNFIQIETCLSGNRNQA